MIYPEEPGLGFPGGSAVKNPPANDDPVCKTAKKTQMCIADFWTQRDRERVG